MRTAGKIIAGLLAVPAFAQTAGPPVPAQSRLSPAEQAISHTHSQDPAPSPTPVTCRGKDGGVTTACGVKEGARLPATQCRGASGEIIVCAGRSPDRIPLPEEREAETSPGQTRSSIVGQGPFPPKPGTTVARFGMGKTAKTRNATLRLIYEQEAAKKAAAERAKAAEVQPPPQ